MLNLSSGIVQWLLGVVFGVMDAWNRKLTFVLWLILLISLICIAFFVTGTETFYTENWLVAIGRLIIGMFGIWCGNLSYKSVFEEE